MIASVGHPLRWLTGDEVFAEWKGELAERVVDGPAFYLEDFPEARAYVATRGTDSSGSCAVVFEKHH